MTWSFCHISEEHFERMKNEMGHRSTTIVVDDESIAKPNLVLLNTDDGYVVGYSPDMIGFINEMTGG
jgi:hypothetical protein